MEANEFIKKQFSTTYLIGITGHIDLIETENLKELLILLQKKHPKLSLLCLGAEGADQITAEIAASLGIDIAGIYLVDYLFDKEHLEDFKPNQEWLKNNENQRGFKKLYVGDGSFEERLYAAKEIGNEEKRKAEFAKIVQDIHAANAQVIAGCSDYIIALWDGVDNGKTGGTAETVHMALHQKDFKGQPIAFAKQKKGIFDHEELKSWKKIWQKPKGRLYHFVSPREKNPFPLGRFPASAGKGMPNAGVYEIGTTPFPIIPFEGNRWQRGWMKVKNAYHHGLFLNYLLPAILVLLTVGLGSFGFKDLRHFEEWKKDSTSTNGFVNTLKQSKKINPQLKGSAINKQVIHNYNWDYYRSAFWPQTNDLFNAINLITFNSSASIDPQKVPIILTIARWSGLCFVLNAFFIAYLLAMGKNYKIGLKIKWRVFWGMPFYVLTGLNEKSYSLAKDLKRQGKSVVIIDGEPDANKMAEAEKKGVLVYKDNSYSAVALSKIKAANAKKAFLLNEDDVNNIRSLQELTQLKPKKAFLALRPFLKKEVHHHYVHLADSRYKDFVCKTNPDNDHIATHVFNIYENTARRLLLKYPVYRFKQDESPETAEIVVFGFGDMAEQLVLSCLRSGFYTSGKKLKITVFTTDYQEKAELFYKKYPAVWHDPQLNLVYEKAFAKTIRDEIFPQNLLTFKELPLSDVAYFSDETIYEAIVNKHIVSMYFCLPQSMQSVAYLHAILAKIQHLQGTVLSVTPQCDVQCFCHYNLQDKDEVENVEHIVNSKIPNSPVIFFGSLTDECTEDAITSRSDELLPKLINVWYEHDRIANNKGERKNQETLYKERKEFWLERTKPNAYIGNLEEEADKRWGKLSITQKESNRYAADHLWVKLYLLGFTYHIISAKMEKPASFEKFVKELTEISGSKISLEITQMARVEHRRWCAEKLLEGFLPAQDFDSSLATNQAETVSKWNPKKDEEKLKYMEYKSYYQEQKLHIDLLPFDELFEGMYKDYYYNEKIKDISLVEAIPYLIRTMK